MTKEFLLREWHKAKEEETSPNCQMKCSGCGAARFGTGICVRHKTSGIDLAAKAADGSKVERKALSTSLI